MPRRNDNEDEDDWDDGPAKVYVPFQTSILIVNHDLANYEQEKPFQNTTEKVFYGGASLSLKDVLGGQFIDTDARWVDLTILDFTIKQFSTISIDDFNGPLQLLIESDGGFRKIISLGDNSNTTSTSCRFTNKFNNLNFSYFRHLHKYLGTFGGTSVTTVAQFEGLTPVLGTKTINPLTIQVNNDFIVSDIEPRPIVSTASWSFSCNFLFPDSLTHPLANVFNADKVCVCSCNYEEAAKLNFNVYAMSRNLKILQYVNADELIKDVPFSPLYSYRLMNVYTWQNGILDKTPLVAPPSPVGVRLCFFPIYYGISDSLHINFECVQSE